MGPLGVHLFSWLQAKEEPRGAPMPGSHGSGESPRGPEKPPGLYLARLLVPPGGPCRNAQHRPLKAAEQDQASCSFRGNVLSEEDLGHRRARPGRGSGARHQDRPVTRSLVGSTGVTGVSAWWLALLTACSSPHPPGFCRGGPFLRPSGSPPDT